MGSFQCAKLTLVLVEVRGVMDVMSVGPNIVIAKEEIILKRREKNREFWLDLFQKIST